MSRRPVPAPMPDLTGHRDGFCIRFGGEEVAVYPALLAARAGLKAAAWAVRELDQVLGDDSATRGAA